MDSFTFISVSISFSRTVNSADTAFNNSKFSEYRLYLNDDGIFIPWAQ